MRGTLYGIGVGPGDPDLITVKAIKTIQKVDVIACPTSGKERMVACDIASEYIGDKPVLQLDMPMLYDQQLLDMAHDNAADQICEQLAVGKDVAFLTLGDVSLYSTFAYVQDRVKAKGFRIELIPGIPAMCATAAKLERSLAEKKKSLHIIPAIKDNCGRMIDALRSGDNVVIMKAGSKLGALKASLKENGYLDKAGMVECCGLPGEKIYQSLEDTDEKSGYFSTILVRGEAKE